MQETSEAQRPISLRPGRPEDYADFARLFTALGVPESPPPPEVWARELMPKCLFVDGPEGPLAYTVTDAIGGGIGFVMMLVVDAPARRRGLGQRIMRAVAERLREQGCREWRLNVKRDNAPARGLYESLGMRPAREAVSLRVTRAQAEALPSASEPLEVVPVTEGDYAALTDVFRLTPGKLAWYAEKPSHRLLRLARPGASAAEAPQGFMDLRAGAGLLYPLYAVTPGHARVLLEDAFARMGLGTESLEVVVTDDAPLVALLREAGAHAYMEMLELRGPLPEP